MTDSNANTSGLEVVAWRIEDLILPQTTLTTDEAYAHHKDVYRYEGEVTATVEPLVTAASAQARIAELEADLSKVIAQRDSHWDEYIAERQSRMEHGAREAGYLDAIPKLTDRATAAEARADRLAKVVVEAAIPLEAMRASGRIDDFSEEMRQGVLSALLAIRAALQQETQK